jgi:hypothetical protein
MIEALPLAKKLLADSAYDADWFRQALASAREAAPFGVDANFVDDDEALRRRALSFLSVIFLRWKKRQSRSDTGRYSTTLQQVSQPGFTVTASKINCEYGHHQKCDFGAANIDDASFRIRGAGDL